MVLESPNHSRNCNRMPSLGSSDMEPNFLSISIADILPYMENMYVRGQNDFVAVTCTQCVAEMSPGREVTPDDITDQNSALCQCGRLACTTEWAIDHIINCHIIPTFATKEMEKSL